MDKLSVIIPVYNVEKYLEECIESVIDQTYNNLEIILVDDGSTDNSGKICDIYQEKDERITVIHKKNGGLSDARNFGIRQASGNYITFLDSDDYIEKNMYELAFEEIKKENAEIFICGKCYLFDNSKKKYDKKNIRLVMNNVEAIDKMNSFNSALGMSACDKVYKKELFNNIEYPVGKLSEDWFTTYKILDKANKIVYNSLPLYVYRQRANSITHSDDIKINEDCIEGSEEAYKFIKNKYPQISLNAQTKYIFTVIGVYNNYVMYKSDDIKKQKKLYKKIKENYVEVIKNKELTRIRKIQLYLIVKHNKIYNYLIKRVKKSKNNKIMK